MMLVVMRPQPGPYMVAGLIDPVNIRPSRFAESTAVSASALVCE